MDRFNILFGVICGFIFNLVTLRYYRVIDPDKLWRIFSVAWIGGFIIGLWIWKLIK